MQRWIGIGIGMGIATLLLSAGCTKQKYGQCTVPNEELKILFKDKTSNPFSHTFCVVCNPTLEAGEYATWAEEMGATSIPDSPINPCLYVYHPAPETQIATYEECVSLVCSGEASYSDMVGNNGNFNLEPLLNPTGTESEEWILAEEESSPMSTPAEGMSVEQAQPHLSY